MAKCKYYRLKKQVSYDNGLNWQDVIPYEYIQGAEYEYHSTDCGYVGNLERWINSGTTCEGYDKYNLQVKQTSTDGINWTTTEETQLGSLIELNSEDCGYVAHKKLQLTYNDSTEYDINCNESSELTNSEVSGGTNPISAITSVEIGDCVTSISRAFSGCTNMTVCNIPNSVTSIGNRAFYGCSGLTSIDIPSGVTSISPYAFRGCTSLTSINIPNSVTSIGMYVFAECRGLTSCTIGSGVTSIGDLAFQSCTSLTSIDIPNSVTSIGMYAFNNCSSLTSCTISSGVTSIGEYAFKDCSGLTSITIEALTPPTLGASAFNNTNNCPIYVPCESVNTYKNATNWSDYASRIEAIPNSCPSDLKFKAWYSDSTTYSAECDSSSALTTADTKTYSTDYSAMTSVIIGDCVTTIGLTDSIFSNDGTFSHCPILTSVTIPNTVTIIGNNVFQDCYALQNITIPNSVTHIGQAIFFRCQSLTSIEIPSGVTFIGVSAFQNCTSLTSVTVNATEPPTLEVVSVVNEFDNTNNCPIYVPCESVNTYKNATNWSKYASRIEAIPNSCHSVKFKAWYSDSTTYSAECDASSALTTADTRAHSTSYTAMTDAVVGDCVTSIGKAAFYGCSSLSSIGIPSGVTSIGGYTFQGCSSLTSIDIPSGVTSIGTQTFAECSNLTSINIPNSVTSIGKAAFYGCSSLSSIDIPSGVTSIGGYTFQGCSSLTSIDIPSGVTSIGTQTFAECSNLTSINIPNSVTSIGESAFMDCSSLTSIDIPSGVTSIGNQTFFACSSLTTIDIPDSVTSIDYSAFNSCSGLTSCTIGSGVTSIGNNAFRNCSGLTSINLPSGVTSIGGGAFQDCYGLTSINLPSGVTSIGEYAFSGCSSLTSLTVNALTPPSLGENAFDNTTCPIYVPAVSVNTYKAASGWSDYASRIQAIP